MTGRIVWGIGALLTACAAGPADVAPPLTPPPIQPHPIPVWLADTDVDVPTGPAPDDLVAVAVVRRRRGDLPGSNALLERALGLDPIHRGALWESGWNAFRSDRPRDAIDRWSRLARIDPDYPGLSRYVPIAEMRAAPADTVVELVPRPGESITVAAVGDVHLGLAWPADRETLPPDAGRPLFQHVAEIITAADIGFGNLETALADSGASSKCRRGSRNCYAFRVPTAFAATLGAVGFDVMSINNNHAGDFGEEGRRATRGALAAQEIRFSGPGGGIASWETRGLRMAMIAFSTGDGPYRVPDIAGAVQAVRQADRDHDLVIVSFHGGAEGAAHTRVPKQVEFAYGENRGDVYRFSRAVVDAGADLVLGHGPHVLRGMEVYKGRLIAYSLGNFTSWHTFNLRGPSGISTVLTVTLAPNGVALGANLRPVRLVRPGIPTPDPDGQAVESIRRLSDTDFGDPLFDRDGVWRLTDPDRRGRV